MELIILIILILIVLFSIVAFLNIKKDGEEIDYHTFFIIGLIWVPFGILAANTTFAVFGVAFIITGLVNKDSWKKRVDIKELSPNGKRMKMALIFFLVFAFLIALGVFFGFLGINV